MIAETDGFGSTYYAAINLVLLAVGAVLHWTVAECIVAVLLALLMYVGAGVVHAIYPPPYTLATGAHGLPAFKVMLTNFYFIILMDIIVVVGYLLPIPIKVARVCCEV